MKLSCALVASVVLALSTTAFSQDIKIGYNSDQSGGGAAEHGVSGRFGVEAAVEDINKAGGVLGRKIVLVNRDDTGQPPKSIQNMNELIDSEKVVAVIGPVNSGNALAWLHLPQQKKIFPRLKERQGQPAGTMSGGEQQMLAMARALMSKPKLLLLDEPSLGLAPLIVRDIFAVIRAVRQRGMTILLVEQMANQALAVADRGYVLETGRITMQGSGKELLANPKIREAYLGKSH